MSTITLLLIICLFILIVLSGFLSGSETALTATSKPRILLKFKKGNKRAGYVLDLLDKKDKDGTTLLIGASLSGSPEMVKTLIDGGANLDIQNNNKDTALMSAAFFCNKEVVKTVAPEAFLRDLSAPAS